MSLLKIRYYPDPILKEKIPPTDIGKPEISNYLKMISNIMYVNNGVGLAAPQVGLKERIITLDIGDGLIYIINPEIILNSKDKNKDEEGCLSLPGVYLEIERNDKITLKYHNEYKKEVKKVFKDLAARAVQHEIDHLDGILIIDRIDRKQRLKTEMNYMDNLKKRY
jgi:peptide deformylase